MALISVVFEATTLTDPTGHLPLGNAGWSKARLPGRTNVQLSE